eukprot:10077182-Alexandrium_andersonii.AAC.1
MSAKARAALASMRRTKSPSVWALSAPFSVASLPDTSTVSWAADLKLWKAGAEYLASSAM